jgi:hypothetical protein
LADPAETASPECTLAKRARNGRTDSVTERDDDERLRADIDKSDLEELGR